MTKNVLPFHSSTKNLQQSGEVDQQPDLRSKLRDFNSSAENCILGLRQANNCARQNREKGQYRPAGDPYPSAEIQAFFKDRRDKILASGDKADYDSCEQRAQLWKEFADDPHKDVEEKTLAYPVIEAIRNNASEGVSLEPPIYSFFEKSFLDSQVQENPAAKPAADAVVRGLEAISEFSKNPVSQTWGKRLFNHQLEQANYGKGDAGGSSWVLYGN